MINGMRCPTCGLGVEDLSAHFAAYPVCEEKALVEFRRKISEDEERMRTEEPERYRALQVLKGLRPASGTDPDFKYPEK